MSNLRISQESIEKRKSSDKLQGLQAEKLRGQFIKLVRKTPMLFKTIRDSLSTGDQFIAQIPKDISEKLRRGELELVKNGETGLFNGMIRKADGNREIVKQVNWKELNISDEMLNNLHQLAVQSTLDEISEKLTEISLNVEKVLQGQHSDRVAKVKAGIKLYRTAQKIKNDSRRNMLLSNALQNLVEGRVQLLGEVEDFINLSQRDPNFIDQYYWKKVRNVDKPLVDLGRKVEEKQEILLEALQFIVLSYSHEFRILAFQEEYEAAEDKRREFIEFVENKLVLDSKLKNILSHKFRTSILDMENSIANSKDLFQGEANVELIISKEDLL